MSIYKINYDRDTVLVHSKGPWKFHKYIRKTGDGEDAVYYYDKNNKYKGKSVTTVPEHDPSNSARTAEKYEEKYYDEKGKYAGKETWGGPIGYHREYSPLEDKLGFDERDLYKETQKSQKMREQISLSDGLATRTGYGPGMVDSGDKRNLVIADVEAFTDPKTGNVNKDLLKSYDEMLENGRRATNYAYSKYKDTPIGKIDTFVNNMKDTVENIVDSIGNFAVKLFKKIF